LRVVGGSWNIVVVVVVVVIIYVGG